MKKIWYTADLHMGSKETIQYFNQPFKTLEEKHKVIIRNWNERVKPGDTVIHVGDFLTRTENSTADKWENKLNGKIIFIAGNHDRNNGCKAIIDNMIIVHGGKRIFIAHEPEKTRFATGVDFSITAHVHIAWKIKRIKRMFDFIDCINVGVDVWDFRPVSINEILARYTRWKKIEEKNNGTY